MPRLMVRFCPLRSCEGIGISVVAVLVLCELINPPRRLVFCRLSLPPAHVARRLCFRVRFLRRVREREQVGPRGARSFAWAGAELHVAEGGRQCGEWSHTELRDGAGCRCRNAAARPCASVPKRSGRKTRSCSSCAPTLSTRYAARRRPAKPGPHLSACAGKRRHTAVRGEGRQCPDAAHSARPSYAPQRARARRRPRGRIAGARDARTRQSRCTRESPPPRPTAVAPARADAQPAGKQEHASTRAERAKTCRNGAPPQLVCRRSARNWPAKRGARQLATVSGNAAGGNPSRSLVGATRAKTNKARVRGHGEGNHVMSRGAVGGRRRTPRRRGRGREGPTTAEQHGGIGNTEQLSRRQEGAQASRSGRALNTAGGECKICKGKGRSGPRPA
ncbi:hypothetical protein ERJ75_000663500 [Trypanosoma vivax]|nr:hypothetical protein ERJ75_000663500 [Trypanosoma vivax]